jgi:pimeloyl-ACP methyl ester carboxylesterase
MTSKFRQFAARHKWKIVSIPVLLLLVFGVILPVVTAPRTELSALAQEWQDSGEYIQWSSPIEENAGFDELNIFTIQEGDPANPAILMIHGYPTSSFDFADLFDLLSPDYYVCAIDTPGYGLSDKPRNGYRYSIEDDAKLIDYYIRDVLNLTSLSVLTHDKGSSVGFALLGLYQNQTDYTITHHFITNGNIYLPLAQLTSSQTMLLNPILGPFVTRYVNGDMVANVLNRDFHTFSETTGRVDAVASILDYQDGGEVQHEIIKYLNERQENEDLWLDYLKNSTIPTTLIWGVNDTVAPTAVADYVWNYSLKDRLAESYYWQLPNAHHYLQNDQPLVISQLLRLTFGESIDFSGIPEEDQPIQIFE